LLLSSVSCSLVDSCTLINSHLLFREHIPQTGVCFAAPLRSVSWVRRESAQEEFSTPVDNLPIGQWRLPVRTIRPQFAARGARTRTESWIHSFSDSIFLLSFRLVYIVFALLHSRFSIKVSTHSIHNQFHLGSSP